MKSINKSLLVAAVMSSALAAFAQNPGGQNIGSGSTSPDPSNETNTTNASGARTETPATTGRTNGGGMTGAGSNTGSDTGADSGINTTGRTGVNSVQDSNTTGANTSVDDMNHPKHKRSFWDRLFGRNKEATTATPNVDSSGRRIDGQP